MKTVGYKAVVKRRSDDELQHFKYISRERKNDRWVYKYPKHLMSPSDKNAAEKLLDDNASLKNEYKYELELSRNYWEKLSDDERAKVDARLDEYDTRNSELQRQIARTDRDITERMERSMKANRLSEASVSKGKMYVKRALK